MTPPPGVWPEALTSGHTPGFPHHHHPIPDEKGTVMPATRDPDEHVSLWSYNPDIHGWERIDQGRRAHLTVKAERLADQANRDEDFRRAWMLTDPEGTPDPVVDRHDPDVFVPFPRVPALPPSRTAWSPLDAVVPEDVQDEGLPPEPPVGTVLAWMFTQGDRTTPNVAVRRADGLWDLTASDEPYDWPSVAGSVTNANAWDTLGVAVGWDRYRNQFRR